MSSLRRLSDAPVTAALIVVNLLVYAAMAVSSGQMAAFSNETLINAGATVAGPGIDATPWRWLTASFIHAHGLHIAMNLWVLAQIGILSETAIGRGLLAAAYVITGITGEIASTVLADVRHQVTLSVGASGAIMGLFGLATVFSWLTNQRAIAKALAQNVLIVLALGFVVTARGVAAVDNAAHVGGLLVGAGLGALRARFPTEAPRWLDVLLISASAALTVAAFAIVHAYGGSR
jgi:membrane associated rhomboid family serine protease